MRINAIQSYNVNQNNNMECKRKQNPNFGLRVPTEIETKVLRSAVDEGSNFLSAVKKQIENLRTLGRKDSVLTEAFDFQNEKLVLGLDNPSISTNYGASLPNKSSLLDTIMGLDKTHIEEAEGFIKATVRNNQNDLVNKAMNNQKLEEKIIGKNNLSKTEKLEKINVAVSNMTEDRVTELRFNLDEPSKYTLDDIIQFDFPKV